MVTSSYCRLLVLVLVTAACLHAQESKPTVRHRQVVETETEDPNAALLHQAETAMEHNDFSAAETALQKVVAAKPEDYRAWFDLGYVYNATQRPADAINAYRKAVAAKPDLFESNLNLGMLLAKQGDHAEAAKYLKAATQLKPSSSPEQALSRAWQALGTLEQASDPQAATVAFQEAAKLSRQIRNLTWPRETCSRDRASSMRPRASTRPRSRSIHRQKVQSRDWLTWP